MKKYLLLFLGILFFKVTNAQVLGGKNAMEFLSLSQSTHISALGGSSVINLSNDASLAHGNPALLRAAMHSDLALSSNFYYSKTKIMNLLLPYYLPKIKTSVAVGLQYLNYGEITMTDNVGNIQGNAKAADMQFLLMVSKSYLTKWRYGATLRFANSQLINEKSFAFLMDVGVAYHDSLNGISMGAVVKNAGYQFKRYNPALGSQSLPLDVQIGFLKKFKNAPFSISVLGHHLYQWDIRYNNPADIVNNTLNFNEPTTVKTKTYFADKLFRHAIIALDMNLGKRIEISAGYNHMRRSELAIADKKGLAGFSGGLGVYLNKFTIHFAQSYFHLAGPYNEIGVNFRLNQLFGMSNFGKKINWSEKYANTVIE